MKAPTPKCKPRPKLTPHAKKISALGGNNPRKSYGGKQVLTMEHRAAKQVEHPKSGRAYLVFRAEQEANGYGNEKN